MWKVKREIRTHGKVPPAPSTPSHIAQYGTSQICGDEEAVEKVFW